LNNYGQTVLPAGVSNVVALAAGDGHSVVLKADGTLISWGYSGYGLANIPAPCTNVAAISAEFYDSAALKNDGSVVVWGLNSYGQTNVPTNVGNATAIALGAYHSLSLSADGTPLAWGLDSYGQTTPPQGLTKVVSISAGWYHSLAIGNDVSANAVSQTTNGAANRDRVITLGGSDANNDALAFRVTVLPTLGTLYQYTNGIRWTAITSADTVVTDPGHRLIFTPPVNGFGSPYNSFSFVANDGETDSLPALVTINIAPPVSPVLTGGIWRTNGLFQLNFSGDSNTIYAVWVSTNLTDWTSLGQANPLNIGLFQFLDVNATNWPQRFHKAGVAQ
jgi:hypothetical protein